MSLLLFKSMIWILKVKNLNYYPVCNLCDVSGPLLLLLVACPVSTNTFSECQYLLCDADICVCMYDLSATRAAAADRGVWLERGSPVHPGFPAGREWPLHPTAQTGHHQPHLRQQWVSALHLLQTVLTLTSCWAITSHENIIKEPAHCTYGTTGNLMLSVSTLGFN